VPGLYDNNHIEDGERKERTDVESLDGLQRATS
jgi:hypothetical protein